ncbi:MAG TPA: cardiolipin synthase [Pelomicrobium sp.]|nr:cardiolipin synthase [Pelomicrobium sp.]
MADPVEAAGWYGLAAAALHVLIILWVGVRVLSQRRPPGSSAAWLLLVVALPYAGALLYLLIGERPLGRGRARRALAMREQVENWLRYLADRSRDVPARVDERWGAIRRLADGAVGVAALAGNRLALLDDAERILRAIIADIDAAAHFCLMEFYIWNAGGTADDVAEALIRAAGRGVKCRVLLDAVGSKEFFRTRWPRRMREAGVEVRAALPAGPLRAAFRRVDLRLHRKIVVVDGHVAYTGSLNLVDPRFFKQDAGIGQWVDAMARIEGPAVEALAGVFAWDWALETGAPLDTLMGQIDMPLETEAGAATVQMVPSGPGYEGHAIVQLLLSAVYGARDELILTTPYFVPDEPLVAALRAAAQRGVRVRLIVPARVDSFLVRYASRAFYDDLLEAGVEILLFDAGLLHTKSVVVDRELAFFGTLNLDIRSFLLNFEVTLIVYDAPFASAVAELAGGYAAASERLDPAVWERRSPARRLTENLVQIAAPLL